MAVYKDTKRGTWYYTGHIKDASGNSHMYKKRGFKKKSDVYCNLKLINFWTNRECNLNCVS